MGAAVSAAETRAKVGLTAGFALERVKSCLRILIPRSTSSNASTSWRRRWRLLSPSRGAGLQQRWPARPPRRSGSSGAGLGPWKCAWPTLTPRESGHDSLAPGLQLLSLGLPFLIERVRTPAVTTDTDSG